MLKKFSVFQLIIMALMAAVGVAVKPLLVGIAHLITGPLFIPGGALAGGFYMMFVVLGAALVGKKGAATIICVVQALLVIVTGVYGSHGVASLITYTAPGILIDFLWILIGCYGTTMLSCFFGGIIANSCGAFFVNFVFFRLPVVPLLLSLALAVFSGALGGIIAWKVRKLIVKHHIMPELAQMEER